MVGIDQVAAPSASEPSQDVILVRSREPAVTDNIRNQKNRRNLPGSPIMARPSGSMQRITNPVKEQAFI